MAIKTIGVLGAGQMGSGIAQIAASKGYKVILRDIKQEFCDNAMAKMKAGLEKRIAKGKATQEDLDTVMNNISTTVELADMKDCDMVIEAAVEILDVKKGIFKDLGEICRPDCIMCTNTSSMSITEITGGCKNPERCMGMHFFSPVYAMKLVEMIRSEKTSDATVAAVREVSEKMGKVPVLCQTDTPGFIVNRCLFAFMLEAIHEYEDGVATIDDIDTAIKLGLNPVSYTHLDVYKRQAPAGWAFPSCPARFPCAAECPLVLRAAWSVRTPGKAAGVSPVPAVLPRKSGNSPMKNVLEVYLKWQLALTSSTKSGF